MKDIREDKGLIAAYGVRKAYFLRLKVLKK